MEKNALNGLKVLDFGWAAVGPLITKTLADFGATVLRVESINRPDPMRLSAPYKDGISGINRSYYFSYQNTNKLSLSLFLKHPKTKPVLQKLFQWCDVVVENFTAGTMENLGLGYEQIKNIKPEIIMVRSCNQGQTGPHARHPGFGYHLAGITGLLHYTGELGGEPLPLPVAYTDLIAPYYAKAALLAALDYRDRTGKGQMIDVSQFETTLHFLSPALLDYVINGNKGERLGNTAPAAVPHNAYRCLGDDRWCVIAINSDAEWHALCQVIGDEKLEKDPRFDSLVTRKQNEALLDRIIESWTIRHSPEAVMAEMQKHGVAAGVVENGRDLFLDPQLKSRAVSAKLKHPEIGDYTHSVSNIIMSETPPQVRLPYPCLGEHTEFICREILKMSDMEFIELLNEGVFT